MAGRWQRIRTALTPMPHFMALAPLDAWIRLLLFPRAQIGFWHWSRVGMGLFMSAWGTAATLPERLILAPILWWKGRRCRHTLEHGPGVLIVLGYPRSGTTHLHYLLACDPRFWTPRWFHALAPQGFGLSWMFFRFLLVPFLTNKRLMDDMAFGAEWPAEDEFAANNWTVASWLPGRMIVPRLSGFYSRFHTLEGLSARELSRWRRYSWAFAWKMSILAGGRSILLKSPGHTARVRALRELYGPDRVRFIHIARDPRAVIKSNVGMFERAAVYHLHDPIPREALEADLIAQLVATQDKYRREAAEVPRDRLAEVRYQDLVADPIGELRRVYAQLGLEWSPGLEARLARYLHTVADYKPATQPGKAAGLMHEAPELDELAKQMGHDRAPVPKRPLPPAILEPERKTNARRIMVLTSLVLIALWSIIALMTERRNDTLIWPVGAIIGYAAVRHVGAGTVRLGLSAGAATLLAFLVAAVPVTYLAEYYPRRTDVELLALEARRADFTPEAYELEREATVRATTFKYQLLESSVERAGIEHDQGKPLLVRLWHGHLGTSIRVGVTGRNNVFWLFMGIVTAYRFASRRHVKPPGW